MFDGRFRPSGRQRASARSGSALRRTGLSPDHLTALGLVLAVPAAVAIGTGRLVLGLVLLIASAVPDLLDGALAKASGHGVGAGRVLRLGGRPGHRRPRSSAAWPGTCRRRHHGHAAVLPFAILAASMLISYERAKAESLGFDGQGRPHGAGRADHRPVHRPGLASVILVPLLWVMLALTLVTAVQRFVKVWRQATAATGTPAAAHQPMPPEAVLPVAGADEAPELSVAVGERWRAWRESNGWMAAARPEPFAHGNRRGASGRWPERRQARLERLDSERPPAGLPPRSRRSSTRRP